MKIGVLTSSRADFGIYKQLLKEISELIDFEIIAFGTHLSKFHGFTIDEIRSEFTVPIHQINTVLANDDVNSIASSYGLTVQKFADFWNNSSFDLVLCLGDRYEMNAALQAGIPYNVKFAHFHGGEESLGAIDNIYRHQITLASQIHFTATKDYYNRVVELIGTSEGVYNVGSIALDKISKLKLLSNDEFRNKYNIPNEDYILVTIHPETKNVDANKKYSLEIYEALKNLGKDYHIVITMPNSDTLGSIYRNAWAELKTVFPNSVTLIENFGAENYYAAMKYSKLLLGNSSSGIIEAASFNKYVINVGDRQKGRIRSSNTLDVDFNFNRIIAKVKEINSLDQYQGDNKYFKENSIQKVINIIKDYDGF
ncbi:UDP-N-acetylglucosamine 2-epimerase [Mangrovivirga sp. M17]|uniref:UDP-N-acetylglucosamine 2-epimerase n=1 Tax=Mangrovivirga halotolerans TaxID=2993936 RepID=A0ABT3RUA0_9BACT|nr:UDP-N-acetylglucosamine 2-epimerase [Mangrovivirga halotolerans]MCX2745188.1 UDP-N-acetylglucosamine 2-epimerase [Mangrovivirga halotolerans]